MIIFRGEFMMPDRLSAFIRSRNKFMAGIVGLVAGIVGLAPLVIFQWVNAEIPSI
jgi:hypothetical protein